MEVVDRVEGSGPKGHVTPFFPFGSEIIGETGRHIMRIKRLTNATAPRPTLDPCGWAQRRQSPFIDVVKCKAETPLLSNRISRFLLLLAPWAVPGSVDGGTACTVLHVLSCGFHGAEDIAAPSTRDELPERVLPRPLRSHCLQPGTPVSHVGAD